MAWPGARRREGGAAMAVAGGRLERVAVTQGPTTLCAPPAALRQRRREGNDDGQGRGKAAEETT